MRAKFINETFEKKSKTDRRSQLNIPGWATVYDTLICPVNSNIWKKGSVYNISVSFREPWNDIQIFANEIGLIINSHLRIYDRYDWKNPEEEHRQKIEEFEARDEREREFYEMFKDLLIRSMENGNLFSFLKEKEKNIVGPERNVNGKITNREVFYSKKKANLENKLKI